jgi:hypothetical protein
MALVVTAVRTSNLKVIVIVLWYLTVAGLTAE